MGTEKRERQKANRAAKMQQQAAQDRAESRRRTGIGFVVVVAAVAVIVALIYFGRGDSDSSNEKAADTTIATTESTIDMELTATEFTFGTTPCPPADGSAERTITFDDAPENCLDDGKTYTATFDTTAGEIDVDLDTEKTPGTANNFVFLARYGYYDDTKLFRVGQSIDIIQGGSPHTQSSADPGPGYELLDEGEFNETATQGGYTYSPGDLVMARTARPNGAGAQFFFVTGDKGANLDAQGTYVVFGHVTKGLEELQKIVETADVDASGEGEPSPEVTVNKVTITEK